MPREKSVYKKMSKYDRGEVDLEKSFDKKRQKIESIAGAPGAYTTRPGGIIQNRNFEGPVMPAAPFLPHLGTNRTVFERFLKRKKSKK